MKKWVLAGLCLVSVVLMVLPAERSRWICRCRGVRLVMVPLSEAGTCVTRHLRTRLDETISRPQARLRRDEDERITALRQQILLMRQMINRQRKQIQTLTKWTGALKGFTCKLLPAVVIGAEPLPLRDRRLLGAGSGDGVETGDIVTTRRLLHEAPVALPERLTVLGRNYVVGQINDCAAHTATLLLVTDRDFKIDARLWRMIEPGGKRVIEVDVPGGGRRLTTFRHDGKSPASYPVEPSVPVTAEGDGRRVVLRHVRADHGIRPGDILTSSDLTQRLPLGLSIGRVSRVERGKKDAHFVTVFVEPLADLRGLREVYIVLPYRQAGTGG